MQKSILPSFFDSSSIVIVVIQISSLAQVEHAAASIVPVLKSDVRIPEARSTFSRDRFAATTTDALADRSIGSHLNGV